MRAHRTDTLSLVFGLFFVLIASGFLLDSYFKIDLPDVGFFVAGGLILVGVITAVGAIMPDRKPKEPAVVDGPADAIDEVSQP